jgi:hypothetical protein
MGTIDDPCSETELCVFFIKEKKKEKKQEDIGVILKVHQILKKIP